MKQPSTDWKEDIQEGEEEKFQKFARQFGILQKMKSKQFGAGRALHRKQILGLKADLEVLGDIPEHARHGLFAFPGHHEAYIRLSNGSLNIQPDSTGDIRGFAIKVRGIDGPGALTENTDCQDFLLINLPAFSSPKSEQFVQMVQAAAQGNAPLFRFMVGTYGFLGGILRMKKLAASVNRRFSGFATEKFYSAAPIACGPYAARVRLLPDTRLRKGSGAIADLAEDMKSRLQNAPLQMDFQLQFFTDEKHTPIEDASVDWKEKHSPYVTVARLSIPAHGEQELADLGEAIEKDIFDPWQALKDHRPLGDVMRARKHVYFASQKGRGAR
ncbi:MAG: catalase [Spirochaetaceae bacterium]|nr:catalase [Spirochaetaceae bacterium]|tara:strand:- start:35645 stop:36628 length:984 start_codon:yes stop_codon:yes gene_type:complete